MFSTRLISKKNKLKFKYKLIKNEKEIIKEQ
jgi:hypothetical protein